MEDGLAPSKVYENSWVTLKIAVVFDFKMKQDELEEEVFVEAMRTHMEMIKSLVVAGKSQLEWTTLRPLLMRTESLVSMALLVLILLYVLPLRKVFSNLFLFNLEEALGLKNVVLEHEDEVVAVFGMQGRRANMEDRFVAVKVGLEAMEKDMEPVRISAVLDGHGGEVRTRPAKLLQMFFALRNH